MERPAGDVLGLELVDAAGSQQAFTPMMRPNLVASQASQDEHPPPHTPAVGVCRSPRSKSLRAFASPIISGDMLLLSLPLPVTSVISAHPIPISHSRRIVSRSSRFGSSPPPPPPTSFPIISFLLSRLRNLSQDPNPTIPCNIASPQHLPRLC